MAHDALRFAQMGVLCRYRGARADWVGESRAEPVPKTSRIRERLSNAELPPPEGCANHLVFVESDSEGHTQVSTLDVDT